MIVLTVGVTNVFMCILYRYMKEEEGAMQSPVNEWLDPGDVCLGLLCLLYLNAHPIFCGAAIVFICLASSCMLYLEEKKREKECYI